MGWGLAAATALAVGPLEVAVVGESDDPVRARLHRTALMGTSPGAAVAVGSPDSLVPLLADRHLVDGASAVYVCHHFTCDAPVTTEEQVAQAVLAVQPPR